MKTIEEKAKAYDEAVKRGLDYIRHTPATEMVTRQDIFEAIFPELAESKDEKIRKRIIALVNAHGQGMYKDEMLVWLEKQGRKETTWNKEDEENMNNVLYILNQLKDTSSYEEDSIAEKTINWFKSLKDRLCSSNEYDKDMLGAIVYCIKNNRPLEKEHIEWLEKQGEQKPFNYENGNIQQKDFAPKEVIPRYNVGDVLCDKSCTTLGKEEQSNFEITDIRNGMYICDKCSFPISQQDEYELVAKKIEQKPAWYEKDEIGLGDALWAIEQARTIAKDENDMGNLWYAEKWLKSLKQMVTWKPSEGQMQALKEACDKHWGPDGLDPLYTLYKDLERLKR